MDANATERAGCHDTPEGHFWVTFLTRATRPGWYWTASTGPDWYGPHHTSTAAYNAALRALTPDFE